MSKLKSNTNTRTIERQIRRSAREAGIVTSRNAAPFFEHGRWWIENTRTRAQWGVHDTATGFCFEQVTEGVEDG